MQIFFETVSIIFMHPSSNPSAPQNKVWQYVLRDWFDLTRNSKNYCRSKQEGILCAHASPWASLCRLFWRWSVLCLHFLSNSRLNFSPGISAISNVFRLKGSLTSVLICCGYSRPSLGFECRLLAWIFSVWNIQRGQYGDVLLRAWMSSLSLKP